MRLPLIAMLILLAANVLTDLYIYFRLKRHQNFQWLKKTHIVFSAILYLAYLAIEFSPKKSISNDQLVVLMWTLFIYTLVYFPKYFYFLFGLISRLPELFGKKKWKRLPHIGLAAGSVIFAIMLWGATVTVRQLDVKQITVESDKVPEAFNGYRLVQFSDMHTGTYGSNTDIVENIVDEINRQNADLIVFTGDIVNRNTDEIRPFIPSLRKLKATDGVYSILGNHDYGDYMVWPSEEAKKQNMQQLVCIQNDSLGWTLLRNEHTFLRRGNDSIALIGVENWGEPPFNTHGDLKKAYPNPQDDNYKLLLSHNPKHWELEVVRKTDIDLTLSGHTHAMQTVISFGGYSFSPSEFRYEHWSGLTEAQGQSLYVNIGTGEVGIPMRIGATPEITVITLRRTAKPDNQPNE